MHGTFGIRMLLKIRGRRVNLLLLAWGRSRRLLLRKDFRDRAAAIKAKAKDDHLQVADISGLQPARARAMLPLPSAWTLEEGFSSEARIPELWDTSVLIIGGTYTDAVCSS